MTEKVSQFARRALWTLPVWAVFLFLATLSHQPDPQTAFAGFAAYVTTDLFLASHLVASIAGAALGSIGVVALLLHVQETKGAGKAISGMVATVASNIFLTSIFGVAAFAQPAMGRLFLAGQPGAVDFYNEVYAVPLFATAMVALLLFIAGGVFIGLAIAASGLFPRWTGWVYGLAVVGYVVSFILLPVGMSVFSALLILATAVIAWHGTVAGSRSPAPVAVKAGA
ncbi:MAG TPA: hypothetical protein VK879_14310 [Candidatus Sulfomarinibacteraceae bacterium]|nr:hypothetical protein [Candidatus Sulfomarinibacteraceae bacterium]